MTRDPLPTLAALARLATPITRASVADRAPELIVSPHVVAKAEAVRLATLDAIGRWAVPPYDRLLLDIPEVPPAYEPVVLAVLARSCAFGSEVDHAAWGLERLVRMEGRATRVYAHINEDGTLGSATIPDHMRTALLEAGKLSQLGESQ